MKEIKVIARGIRIVEFSQNAQTGGQVVARKRDSAIIDVSIVADSRAHLECGVDASEFAQVCALRQTWYATSASPYFLKGRADAESG